MRELAWGHPNQTRMRALRGNGTWGQLTAPLPECGPLPLPNVKGVTEKQRRLTYRVMILDVLREAGDSGMTAVGVAEEIGMSANSACAMLWNLCEKGRTARRVRPPGREKNGQRRSYIYFAREEI